MLPGLKNGKDHETSTHSADMEDMKIVKTTTTEQLPPCKIVTRPSGDQPYHLVCMSQQMVEDLDLHDDVIEDTAEFLSGYDLRDGEEDT